MLSILTAKIFNEHINSKFYAFIDEDIAVELELTEIREKNLGNIEGFSLIFIGPSKASLSDNTYIFKHDKIGVFPIFISSFKEKNSIVYYDAQFSKFKDEEE